MLTVKDFEDLLALELEHGYRLCQYVPYCFGSPEVDQLIQEGNVQGLAKDLIESYVGLLYGTLNRYLREGPTHAIRPLMETFGLMLNESLAYIPSFDDGIVYRNEMTSYPDQLKQWFSSHVGEVVEFPNFLSTYHNREYWKPAEPNFRIQTSKNSKGKSICIHVGKPSRLKESEILFQSNSRFMIVSVDDMIHLQETEEESSQILWEGYFYSYDDTDTEEQSPLSLLD